MVSLLESRGFEVVLDKSERNLTESELIKVLPGIDVHIAGVDQYTDKVMAAADKLSLICRIGVGVENVNIEAASAKGILVTNTPGAGAETVAEFTFGLMMALTRRIAVSQEVVRSGKWNRSMGRSIIGKKLGIIGFGNIGAALSKMVSGFNMNIVVYDPYMNAETAAKHGIQLVSLPELLRESDYVSVHVPFNSGTENMIGQKELALMKPSAMLINTSRGGIVNEAALHDALKNGIIDSAALDVFSQEPPPPDHPLLKLPNVLVTAHNAGTTYEGRNKLMEACVRTVIDVADGKQPAGLKNPLVWGRARMFSSEFRTSHSSVEQAQS
ncbi:phosphoglycerate dehydrogenase [Ottowia thiooxydans]